MAGGQVQVGLLTSLFHKKQRDCSLRNHHMMLRLEKLIGMVDRTGTAEWKAEIAG